MVEQRIGQATPGAGSNVRSFYFYDPDGIMLEFCPTVNEGSANVDLPVNANGMKANGEPITGA